MKKAIIFILGCLISVCCFAQEFEMKLIAGFENKKGENSIVIRKASEVDVSDDVTGNILSIAEDGTMASLRPSGTEPKIKFYFEVRASDPKEKEAKVEALKKQFAIE